MQIRKNTLFLSAIVGAVLGAACFLLTKHFGAYGRVENQTLLDFLTNKALRDRDVESTVSGPRPTTVHGPRIRLSDCLLALTRLKEQDAVEQIVSDLLLDSTRTRVIQEIVDERARRKNAADETPPQIDQIEAEIADLRGRVINVTAIAVRIGEVVTQIRKSLEKAEITDQNGNSSSTSPRTLNNEVESKEVAEEAQSTKAKGDDFREYKIQPALLEALFKKVDHSETKLEVFQLLVESGDVASAERVAKETKELAIKGNCEFYVAKMYEHSGQNDTAKKMYLRAAHSMCDFLNSEDFVESSRRAISQQLGLDAPVRSKVPATPKSLLEELTGRESWTSLFGLVGSSLIGAVLLTFVSQLSKSLGTQAGQEIVDSMRQTRDSVVDDMEQEQRDDAN